MIWSDSEGDENNWLGGRGRDKSKGSYRRDWFSLFGATGKKRSYDDSKPWDDFSDFGEAWFTQPPKDELVDKLDTSPESSRAVDRLSYDAQEFNRIAEKNFTMRGVAKRGQSVHKDFPVLVEDVFNAFHKGHPVLKHDSELDDFSKFSKKIVKAILDDPRYDTLRQTTKWDRLYSAYATRALDELFKKCGGGSAGNAGEKSDKPESNNKASQKGEGEDGEQGGGSGSDDKQESGEQKDGKQDGEQGGSGTASPQEAQEEQLIKEAVSEFMDKAVNEVAEAEKTASKWGIGSGSAHNVSEGEIDELLNLLKTAPNIDSLTDMIGRISGIMNDVESEATSITHGAPIGYVLGDELSRMSPQEYVNLAHPDLRLDLKRRIQEHSVQVIERESPESLGQGPMIVLLDGSQSMMNDYCNSDKCRMTWAVAMAIMLYRRAMTTGQPFILHKFSYNTYSFRYDRPASQYANFLKEVMVMENGGTNIDPAMDSAIESLKEYPEGDMVILSDCELNRKWYNPEGKEVLNFNRATAEAKCKVVGVLINESEASAWHGDDEDTTSSPFQNLCHVAFQINPKHKDMVTQVTDGVFREIIL